MPSPSLHCRSVDPGPSRSAVAYLSYSDGRFRLIEGCWRRLDVLHDRSDRIWMEGKLEETREDGGLFAVETIVGFAFQASRVQQLLETTRVEGALLTLGVVHGLDPIEIPAGDGKVLDHDATLPKLPPKKEGVPARTRRRAAEKLIKGWRAELCHTPWASDAQIRIVVEGIVQGDGKKRTAEEEEHLYDAIGVGIVAICRHLDLRIRLPPSVETALWKQQAAEKEERARNRAAGITKPKQRRPPTRAQRKRRGAAQIAGASR